MPSPGGAGSLTPSPSGGSNPSSDAAASWQEYQAGLAAYHNHQNDEAMKHFFRSAELDPGAPWAADAERYGNKLSGQ